MLRFPKVELCAFFFYILLSIFSSPTFFPFLLSFCAVFDFLLFLVYVSPAVQTSSLFALFRSEEQYLFSVPYNHGFQTFLRLLLLFIITPN